MKIASIMFGIHVEMCFLLLCKILYIQLVVKVPRTVEKCIFNLLRIKIIQQRMSKPYYPLTIINQLTSGCSSKSTTLCPITMITNICWTYSMTQYPWPAGMENSKDSYPRSEEIPPALGPGCSILTPGSKLSSNEKQSLNNHLANPFRHLTYFSEVTFDFYKVQRS